MQAMKLILHSAAAPWPLDSDSVNKTLDLHSERCFVPSMFQNVMDKKAV